jgi:hypothetical protein
MELKSQLWPATGGRLPSTPEEWARHFHHMAQRGVGRPGPRAESRPAPAAGGQRPAAPANKEDK